MLRTTILLLLGLLLTAATCNKTAKDAPVSNDCIDEAKAQPDLACFEVYEPVCGCDGKTYSNKCYATRAGVIEFIAGECSCVDPAKADANRACEKIYKPVCGCDNTTYSNQCEAEKAGIKSWKEGKCKS